MNDEEIRKAAWGSFNSSVHDVTIERVVDVYRAGMEAGRAEAAAKPKRRKAATVEAEPKATITVAEMMRHGVQPLAAEDWLRVRRQHKAPLTRTAWEATKREADAAHMTIGAAVQMCAERGWRGFRAEYVARNQQAGHWTARIDRQLETAALMTGATRQAPVDMGEIYDVGQRRITSR